MRLLGWPDDVGELGRVAADFDRIISAELIRAGSPLGNRVDERRVAEQRRRGASTGRRTGVQSGWDRRSGAKRVMK